MSSGSETVTLGEARFERILARFVADGKLVVIPAKRANKLIVFAWLARRFEPYRPYTEREINAALALAHADVATLRRGLYDEYFLDRADGVYRRTPEAQRLVIAPDVRT